MTQAIIFDCEFLAQEGSLRRLWCGPDDPDPLVVQIGAVRLDLTGDFALGATFRRFIRPIDRTGAWCRIDPFLTELTGITDADIAGQGVPLADALQELVRFAEGARLWSWGKDEIYMMALSCYVAGLAPPIPVTRFGNAGALLLQGGMSHAELEQTRSNALAGKFGIARADARAHDALDDAMSVALVLQLLLRQGKLAPAALR